MKAIHQQKPTLWALLVGIDAYQEPTPPLSGCVNDINKVSAFLETQTDNFAIKPLILTDEAATKDNIVNGFRTHLSKAKKEDVVLFYYSGHGTQEEADSIFHKTEADKKLETLVCYDSLVKNNGVTETRLLADKELRYLIHEIASASGPHIVTVFDCCHSGGNTRNSPTHFIAAHHQSSEVKVRRISQAFPKREWSAFIFGKTLNEKDILENGLSKALPEGKHIQLAACQNDESAYEVDGGGVFTKNLLDVLYRCNGNISYHRLQSTVQGYLRHQFQQTPKIYTSEGNSKVLFSNFLQKTSEETGLLGVVSYNKSLGWILDMGSMQGIGLETVLELRDPESGKSGKSTVTSVFPTYSKISMPENWNIDDMQSVSFNAYIKSFLSHPLHLYRDKQTTLFCKQSGLEQKLNEIDSIMMVDTVSKADYGLLKRKKNLVLSRAVDLANPIVPKVSTEDFSSNEQATITNYLKHISAYNFVKQLTNPGTFLLRPDMIKVSIYDQMDPKTPVPISGEQISLSYTKSQHGWGGGIRLSIKNVTNRKLYCALCYLSMNFGVHTQLFPEGVIGLDPRASAWAFSGEPIRFKLEPEVVTFNYKESTSFLKLLISTEDFTQQLNTMRLDDLPSPVVGMRSGHKGLQLSGNPSTVQDWTTRLITLKMPNPEYKEVL